MAKNVQHFHAPAGARDILSRVAYTAHAQGRQTTARALGISERQVARITNAIDKGRPLGPIVHSHWGLERWVDRTSNIPSRIRAVEIRESFSMKRIAEQMGVSESTGRRFLAKFTAGESTKEERKALAKLQKELKNDQPEKVKVYLDKKKFFYVMLYKSEDQMPEEHEFRTDRPTLAQAVDYIAEVGGGGKYFFILRTADDLYNIYFDPNA